MERRAVVAGCELRLSGNAACGDGQVVQVAADRVGGEVERGGRAAEGEAARVAVEIRLARGWSGARHSGVKDGDGAVDAVDGDRVRLAGNGGQAVGGKWRHVDAVTAAEGKLLGSCPGAQVHLANRAGTIKPDKQLCTVGRDGDTVGLAADKDGSADNARGGVDSHDAVAEVGTAHAGDGGVDHAVLVVVGDVVDGQCEIGSKGDGWGRGAVIFRRGNADLYVGKTGQQ